MGLFYFTIKVVKATKAPLCLSKDGKAMKCVMLPTMSFHKMNDATLLSAMVG